MTRPLIFLPAAQLEVIEAQAWYEKEVAGLGVQFRDELDKQAARIVTNPLQFPIVLADVRRARLRRFPYGVLFRVVDDAAYVIACFHSSRDPRIWQKRVKE